MLLSTVLALNAREPQPPTLGQRPTHVPPIRPAFLLGERAWSPAARVYGTADRRPRSLTNEYRLTSSLARRNLGPAETAVVASRVALSRARTRTQGTRSLEGVPPRQSRSHTKCHTRDWRFPHVLSNHQRSVAICCYPPEAQGPRPKEPGTKTSIFFGVWSDATPQGRDATRADKF